MHDVLHFQPAKHGRLFSNVPHAHHTFANLFLTGQHFKLVVSSPAFGVCSWIVSTFSSLFYLRLLLFWKWGKYRTNYRNSTYARFHYRPIHANFVAANSSTSAPPSFRCWAFSVRCDRHCYSAAAERATGQVHHRSGRSECEFEHWI